MMPSRYANLSLGSVIAALRNAFSVLLIHGSRFPASNGGSSGFLGLTLFELVDRAVVNSCVVVASDSEKARACCLRASA